MAQQTAVEWLFQKMTEQGTNAYWDMRFIQAKQMEKEQIMNAHGNKVRWVKKYGDIRECEPFDGEQYYNETYGK